MNVLRKEDSIVDWILYRKITEKRKLEGNRKNKEKLGTDEKNRN